jgi:Family of unknown function (DUF5706)
MEERKTEFLRSHFELVESQVQFGDHKASLLVAGDAILLVTCGGLIRTLSGCQGDKLMMSCITPSASLTLALIAAALVISSLFLSLLAALPNKVHGNPPPELFLLSHVAHTPRHTFIKEYRAASYDDIVEQALVAIHGKARYADKKFRLLRWAIRATLLGLGFIVLTLLITIGAYFSA